MRYWRPEDITMAKCPHCQAEIEFWKDEPMSVCRACGKEVRNPKQDLGCADWCKHGTACLGHGSETHGAEPSAPDATKKKTS